MIQAPKHVAIVMDGNGRWAKQRLLPRTAGHHAGAKSVRRAVQYCVEQGIEILTLFALSVENKLTRPPQEVTLLMSLFLESLQKNTLELNEKNVRIRIMGDLVGLSPKLLKQIKQSEQLTAQNMGMQLVIAINYSGRWDIVNAAKQMAHDVQLGLIKLSDVDESVFSNYVQLHDIPDPDLLIRTSGEQRISNFLLWQLAYTEIYFTKTYWPDFDDAVFEEALLSYATRERRFGKTSEQLKKEHCA